MVTGRVRVGLGRTYVSRPVRRGRLERQGLEHQGVDQLIAFAVCAASDLPVRDMERLYVCIHVCVHVIALEIG